MRHWLLLVCFLLLQSGAVRAELLRIDGDSLTVSLLTCSAGEELYSSFGHSAIRVQDKLNHVDAVFNYGTFDFDQPNFYVNFVKGLLLYSLSLERYDWFVSAYRMEQRSVTEQVLHLSKEQKERVVDFLRVNYRKENRDYRYEFFFDNCATRIRDVFEKCLGDTLRWDYSGFDTTLTLRQCLKPHVAKFDWVPYGFDLILGIPCDIKATPRMQTFLPVHLQHAFAQATVVENGQPVPFVETDHIILQYAPPPARPSLFNPANLNVLLLLFFVLLTVYEWKRGRVSLWPDRILFFITGLLGCFFTGMFFTEHYSPKWNMNVLWLLPSNVVVCWFAGVSGKWVRYYFLLVAVICLLLLIGFRQLPQEFNPAFVPLIMTLLLRAGWIFYQPPAKAA